MENLSNLDRHDWYHSLDTENKVVYVKYMNLSVLSLLFLEYPDYKIHYSSFRTLDPANYVQVLEDFSES